MSDPLRKRLLERTFKYTKSGETDVARTFARIRRQIKEEQAAKFVANLPDVLVTPTTTTTATATATATITSLRTKRKEAR